VLIQNGVGVEEAHRERFPKNALISAVTIISAEQISQGVIKQNRWTRISMGAYSDGLGGRTAEGQVLQKHGNERVKELVGLFTKYGKLRDAEYYDEVPLQQVRWHKICINASMNPSAVLSGGKPNADMVRDPELRIHLKACMDEVFQAAPKILGAPFPPKLATPEQILKSTERNTGGKPSMLVDWEHGRPMELEVILGNPVRIARRHGVEMPRLQTLYALLKSAQGRRDDFNRQKKELERQAIAVKSTLWVGIFNGLVLFGVLQIYRCLSLWSCFLPIFSLMLVGLHMLIAIIQTIGRTDLLLTKNKRWNRETTHYSIRKD
jgi:2-dehydropantoate 2-reductase